MHFQPPVLPAEALTRTALQKPVTVDEFLDGECRQDLRDAFDGFQAHAATSGTGAHGANQASLVGVLHARLRGKPCRPSGSEFKIQMEHSIRYADAMATCTPRYPLSLRQIACTILA